MRIAAADIGGTDIKYALIEKWNGHPEFELKKFPTPLGGKAILSQLGDLFESLGHFDAIAICTAGQVNNVTGTIIYANDNIPEYTGTNVRDILQRRFNCPVTVLNDVNAAAIGEGVWGSAKDFSDYLCLTYGTGIGGAIVINRHVYEGSTFSAGEFGHIVTHANGIPCACGGLGCYETYASTGALVRLVTQNCGEYMNGIQILQAIRQRGDIAATVDIWINEVLIGLSALCHVFNPSCIVLAGGIMNDNDIIARISGGLSRHIMKSYAGVQIKKAKLGSAAGIIGAAAVLHREMGCKR